MRLVESAPAARWAIATLCLVISIASAGSASAATYTVNALDDLNDSTCDVTHCSLRDAVELAVGAGDRVVFDFTLLGQSAPFEIVLDQTIDIADDSVTVDGLDCAGCGTPQANTNDAADGFDSVLAVRIVSSGTFPAATTLFSVSGNSVTLIGLNIDRATGDGLAVSGDDVSVQNCFIGTSIAGEAGPGNLLRGIVVTGSGVDILDCLVSSNKTGGIAIEGGGADDPIVQRNIVGLEIDASATAPNVGHGILLSASTDLDRATIGGLTPAEGNVVSANTGDGIRFEDKVDGLNELFVEAFGIVGNNIVGTDGAITVARPNTGHGLAFQGGSGGGMEPRKFYVVDNVFSGNGGAGVFLESTKQNTFHGNAIGTDQAGTVQLGNGAEGIYLLGGPGGGGSTANRDTKQMVFGGVGVENRIAYNGGDGIRLAMTATPSVQENTFAANSIYANGGLGIDAEEAGANLAAQDDATTPAANTCGNVAAWANGEVGPPVISATNLLNGVLTVSGTSCNNATVDIYLADGDASGYGEPMTYLGTTGAVSSSWTTLIAVGGITGVGGGQPLTALQTDGEGETSQPALNVLITAPCDADGDGYDNGGGGQCVGLDCDDSESTVYPGAPELCDGLDNPCNLSLPADEADADGDGVMICDGDCDDSNATVNDLATELCDGLDTDCSGSVPTNEADNDTDGFMVCANDCDDNDSTINPSATEVCNQTDDDCDGNLWDQEVDDDGDTFNECAGGDCDDTDALIFVGQTEACNATDDDCDTVIDDGFDTDGDGYTTCGADGIASNADDDCNDTSNTVYPGATELCNGVDDDCTGLPANEADADGDLEMPCQGDCDDSEPSVNTSATEICNAIDDDCDTVVDDGFDLDGDLFTTCGADGTAGTADDDCNDAVPTINTGATEVCNLVDDDCDTFIDEGFDVDGDGVFTCGPDGDVNTDADDDCDDAVATTFPGATETCNAVDDDCDTFIDEDFDADGDTITTCGANGSLGDSDDDCDDSLASVYPGATEVCNAIDDDCDAVTDDGFDADIDGFTTCGADGDPNTTADNDCDDLEASVNPGETEVCNGIDDDCDVVVDEGFDVDNDGVFTCGPDWIDSTPDDDCDDTLATVYPGATEVPDDGVDQDCDGFDTVTCYVDLDGDTYGASAQLDADGDCGGTDQTATPGDCDDNANLVYPGQTEACNGVDDDCDVAVDEDFDADSDGYPSDPSCTVTQDCDDSDPAINPGATEVCDNVDNDCDSLIDEADDVDGDTYSGCDGDCDDNDPNFYPGAPELCDGLDTDCDGTVPSDEFDLDGDNELGCEGDCNDGDTAVNTSATEVCNLIDDDCDTDTDEGFDVDGDTVFTCGPDGDPATTADNDCDDTNATVFPGASEVCNGIDEDCEGGIDEDFNGDADLFTTCGADGNPATTADNDCDDTDATIYPGAVEIPDDGIDQDCSGADTVTCYVDLDGDAYGTTSLLAVDGDCTSAGETATPGDCDDTSAAVFPGQTELCDGVDQDCDGALDNGFDADNDGYPIGASCTVTVDCDDTNAAINPGATEICDSIDNNCDGTIDEEVDSDGDGMTGCDGDCDDNNDTVYDGAPELCDGLDNACAGAVPADETDDDGDGFNECGDDDCDDSDANVFVGQTEACTGVDDDCDGDIDEDQPDLDEDTYDDCQDGDCDDTDDLINPSQTEVCDGVDEDCDGDIDNGFDADDDGSTTCGPDGIPGNADDDCDDEDATVNPLATELCDGVDNDCDGDIDEEADDDADGFTNCEGDCDDADPEINPEAEEVCGDGIDQDCDDVDAVCEGGDAVVTLGEITAEGCTGCSAERSDSPAPLLVLLGLAVLPLRRRRVWEPEAHRTPVAPRTGSAV